MNKVDINNVPNKPGVYLWKNKNEEYIYIGKAIDLKKRMGQYFKDNLHSYRIPKMVSEIESFEYIIASSEKDALVLERNLIEKHKPKYNALLKDDRAYPYVKIKKGIPLWAGLTYRARQEREKAYYFGPLPNGYGAKRISNLLNRMFVYQGGLPNKSTDKLFWDNQFKEAKSLLSGGVIKLSKTLEKKMYEAAEKQQFEIASEMKATIESLNFFSETQVNQLNEKKNIDVFAFVEKNGFLSVSILFYKMGIMLSKKDHVIRITTNVEDAIRQFASQFYAQNIKPDYIISNFEFESSIQVVIPIKANKKKILNIAIENASDNIDLKFSEYKNFEQRTKGAVEKLSKVLNIDSANFIQMIDTSSTNNTQPIAAIISYRGGVPSYHEFRKYSVEVNDRKADVDYMSQGVIKHFSNIQYLPDVFIVDGGIAQINEIKTLIPDTIKLVGLVKNDKHRTEKFIDEFGNEIKVDDQLFKFLTKMQVEVDAYAKRAHTKKRVSTLEGKLLSIKGVGPSTEKKLLEHFKSYAAIYNASVEELSEVVSERVAKLLKEILSNEEND